MSLPQRGFPKAQGDTDLPFPHPALLLLDLLARWLLVCVAVKGWPWSQMSGFKSQLHHPPKCSWASSRDQVVCLSFRLWSSTVFAPRVHPLHHTRWANPAAHPRQLKAAGHSGQPGTGLAFTSLALQAPPFPSQTSHSPALPENQLTFSAPLERPPAPSCSQPRGVCPSAAVDTADCPLLLDVLL